jgi:hypothetical protein
MKVQVDIFNMNTMKREVHDCLKSEDFFKEEMEIISHINKKNEIIF